MVIWGVLLFIAGCIIADTARQYDDKTLKITYRVSGTVVYLTFCDSLKEDWVNSDARCGHLVGATVSWQL